MGLTLLIPIESTDLRAYGVAVEIPHYESRLANVDVSGPFFGAKTKKTTKMIGLALK